MFAPFWLRTPITLKATFRTRISFPMGECPAKSSLTIVLPTMQTLLALRTSCSVNASPSAMVVQSRTWRKEGVEPWMYVGTQFLLP